MSDTENTTTPDEAVTPGESVEITSETSNENVCNPDEATAEPAAEPAADVE